MHYEQKFEVANKLLRPNLNQRTIERPRFEPLNRTEQQMQISFSASDDKANEMVTPKTDLRGPIFRIEHSFRRVDKARQNSNPVRPVGTWD